MDEVETVQEEVNEDTPLKEGEIRPTKKIKVIGVHYGIDDITGWSTKETTRRAAIWWVRSTPHALITDIEGRGREIPQEVNWDLLEQKDTFVSVDVDDPDLGT